MRLALAALLLAILACSPAVTMLSEPTIQPTTAPQIGMVIADHLNLRDYPYTAKNVLAVLDLGQHVTILGELTNDNPECQKWLYVDVDGRRGWICAQWVRLLGE